MTLVSKILFTAQPRTDSVQISIHTTDPDLSRIWFSVTAGGRLRGKLAVLGQWGTRIAWQGVWHLGNRVAWLRKAIQSHLCSQYSEGGEERRYGCVCG